MAMARHVVHCDERMLIPKSGFVLLLENVISCFLSGFRRFLISGVLRLAATAAREMQ